MIIVTIVPKRYFLYYFFIVEHIRSHCFPLFSFTHFAPSSSSCSSPSLSLPLPTDASASAPSSRLVASPFPYHHCPACARRDPAAYCPFCDLYIGYRVLKVESQLLYKTYEEVQQLARYLETHARVISDISKEAKSGM